MMAKRNEWKSMLQGKEKRKYTVWVGGTEVTDHFVNYTTAKQLHLTYTTQGYTDVVIQEGR